MIKPKEYKYSVKKFTKYSGKTWYECTYRKRWLPIIEHNLFYPRVVTYGGMTAILENIQFPTLEDVQIAIDKHKKEQLEYVQNQIKSVETVKLPQPWKNRIDKDMIGRGSPFGSDVNDLGAQ